jgi:hypothetical protein
MHKTIIIICVSIFLAAAIAEIAIRTIDIPGMDRNTHYTIDPVMGYTDIPHAKVFYRDKNGKVIRRTFNSLGYLDVEHKQKKEKGLYRIGFFGDSYVEARQVHLDDTFFKVVEKGLDKDNVECIAIGQDGTGTLVGYLNSRRWSNYFNLDLVVYVFCENDPGDNIREIKGKTSKFRPFAYLTKDGFGIDYSNLALSRTRTYRVKQWISRHCLLFRLINNRLALLFKYGPKVKVSEADRKMATKAEKGKVPDQNDLPSTWPTELKEYAEKLDFEIIRKWADEIKADSKKFAVLYVPRESEMHKETSQQDSWKPWLASFCRDSGIAFIDPTDSLLGMQYSGKAVFSDHFTADGHQAFAAAFVEWFKDQHGKGYRLQ